MGSLEHSFKATIALKVRALLRSYRIKLVDKNLEGRLRCHQLYITISLSGIFLGFGLSGFRLSLYIIARDLYIRCANLEYGK
jgi:hypothetical protein